MIIPDCSLGFLLEATSHSGFTIFWFTEEQECGPSAFQCSSSSRDMSLSLHLFLAVCPDCQIACYNVFHHVLEFCTKLTRYRFRHVFMSFRPSGGRNSPGGRPMICLRLILTRLSIMKEKCWSDFANPN